jgi:hypothetical protein
MKNFRQFITEEMSQFSGFLISRDNMPQIKNVKDYVNFIERQGIRVDSGNMMVYMFRPTQINFEQEKVDRIKADVGDDTSTMTPIVVSEDGFVLDGHHRYFAARQMDISIPVITVNLPINKLLKLTNEYLEYSDG